MKERNVYVGEGTYGGKYMNATPEQEKAVFSCVCGLISKRQQQVQENESNKERFPEILKKCESIAQNYMSRISDRIEAKLRYGHTQKSGNRDFYAIVIREGNSPLDQIGYIEVYLSDLGDITFTIHGTFGGYNEEYTSDEDLPRIIEEACRWMTSKD